MRRIDNSATVYKPAMPETFEADVVAALG